MNSCRRVIQFRFVTLCCLVFLLGGVALAQEQPLQSVTYRLAMSRPVSHLFEVSIQVQLAKDSKAQYVDFPDAEVVARPLCRFRFR